MESIYLNVALGKLTLFNSLENYAFKRKRKEKKSEPKKKKNKKIFALLSKTFYKRIFM